MSGGCCGGSRADAEAHGPGDLRVASPSTFRPRVIRDAQGFKKILAKVFVIGDSGVGKTSLITQFERGFFSGSTKPTIGCDFITKTIESGDSRVTLQVWDTAGDSRFSTHHILPMLFRGADAGVIVFDRTNPTSFANVDVWIQEMTTRVGCETRDLALAIVGNKSDLASQCSSPVTRTDVENFIKQKQLSNAKYFEVSAKSGASIGDSFAWIAASVSSNQSTIFDPPPVF